MKINGKGNGTLWALRQLCMVSILSTFNVPKMHGEYFMKVGFSISLLQTSSLYVLTPNSVKHIEAYDDPQNSPPTLEKH